MQRAITEVKSCYEIIKNRQLEIEEIEEDIEEDGFDPADD